MIVPEEILKKQLCSECHKYLSVGPIKVYPNREIRCGRCTKEDDLGVESSLYQIVVKDMKFPCVNSYDGCNTVLPMSKMIHHENDCNSNRDLYDCFLCSEFKGIAYDLNLHCQKYHQKETLQNSEFLINFSPRYQCQVFFHSKGTRLFFIQCNHDIDLARLTVDVTFIGKHYKGIMSYSIRLYSINKDLLYKSTKPLLCSIMELKLGTRAVVNITSMNFPRKLAVCQVFIHEEPEFSYVENIPVIDSSFDTCILKCAFKDLLENNFDETALFFPAVYYFKDIAWRIYIQRKLSLTDYKRKFGVFLQWNNSAYTVETCKVSATFSLLTSDFRKKLSKSFVKKEYRIHEQSHGLMLADWSYVLNPSSGFVDNGCVNIEVKMKIFFDCKEHIKCNDCNRICVYCSE